MEPRSAKEFLAPGINALLGCALIGCGYRPGAFAYAGTTFVGQRATVGCLDVAVERRADLPTEGAEGAGTGAVLRYQLANRCDRPQVIDLGAVAVVGRVEGVDSPLRPYDPRAELHPVALDGRSVGAESLAYPADRPVPQVCVDVAALARQAPPRWLCFGIPTSAAAGSAPGIAGSAPGIAGGAP